MRVIVTGATSFIGRAVTEALLKEGCQVLAVVRPDSPGREVLAKLPGVTILPSSLKDIGELALPEGAPSPTHWLHMGWEGGRKCQPPEPGASGKKLSAMLWRPLRLPPSGLRTLSFYRLPGRVWDFCGAHEGGYGVPSRIRIWKE